VGKGAPGNRASPWELREWSYLKSAPPEVTDPTEGRTPMSRIVRLSIALVFAIMMMIAFAGAALAFNPPDNAPDGVGANNLCETDFPAFDKAGFNPPGGFVGPWNATDVGVANSPGPIDFGSVVGNECG